jgi:hypothetical protein
MQFESPSNQQFISQAIYADFSKSDSPLAQDEINRLPRMVQHYMKEVNQVNRNMPAQMMNREVMRACSQHILNKREREQATPVSSGETGLLMDTARRFEKIQQDRNSFMKKEVPPAPNFLIEASEDKTNAMELFQRQKSMRDEEMKVATQSQTVKSQLQFHPPTVNHFEMLSSGNDGSMTMPGRGAGFTNDSPMTRYVHGDIRGMSQNGDMTLAIPPSIYPNLQQDILQRKDDILTYKENEYNLFINSIDRNWYYDTPLNFQVRKENRYDYTINFSTANNIAGFAITPAAQIKFKNIVRVELVKAIIPTESIDVFKTRYMSGGTAKTTFAGGSTILSFPYLIVRVEELESNNYGTNSNIDSTFGIIQYDNKWSSEHEDYREYNLNQSKLTNPGYACMIPKFMKCQRIFHPTPLSTLQKMTVRIERPDGTLVNTEMDTFDFIKVFMTNIENLPSGYFYSGTNPYKDAPVNEYIVLESAELFRATNAIAGDRIYVKGFRFPDTFVSGTQELRDAFKSFINRVDGHVVSGVMGLAGSIITEEPNAIGYSKFIIIPSEVDVKNGIYVDYSTLSGGLAGLQLVKPIACRGINGNRQVQVVFRIITREIDSSSRIRADIL